MFVVPLQCSVWFLQHELQGILQEDVEICGSGGRSPAVVEWRHIELNPGRQCLVMESSGTHSVRALQTYSVKCSQGLKVLRDQENVCELR